MAELELLWAIILVGSYFGGVMFLLLALGGLRDSPMVWGGPPQ